jgi:L-cystine uptake protein TcyP (sodium:dicarboxylate symporter family)
VGLELAMQITIEYDYEIFMPLLLSVYNNLTLIYVNVGPIRYVTLELNVLTLTFTEEAALGCLKLNYHFSRKL